MQVWKAAGVAQIKLEDLDVFKNVEFVIVSANASSAAAAASSAAAAAVLPHCLLIFVYGIKLQMNARQGEKAASLLFCL